MASPKQIAERILATADITINGSRPWDIQVHDERLYKRVLASGSIGLGEAYMDGWWDAPSLDQFFAKLLKMNLDHALITPSMVWYALKGRIWNEGAKRLAFKVGEEHYDLGNDLYEVMLDKRLVYTCGYWKDAKNLDEAQEAKLDLICRKIGLKAGDRVLDIGCGWGSFAKFAAEKYGASVVGVTVSKEQVELGKKLCEGLPVEFLLQDYRDTTGQFDHIVSVGMFEHVGQKNYKEFFSVAERCLKPGGLFLLHTIGGNVSVKSNDPWLTKYIFSQGMVPSIAQVGKAIETKFVLEDWHNFGPYYDNTLMAWFHNFDAAWPKLKDKYGERFYRMWKYYLLQCAGSFRTSHVELWQIVLSKGGVPGVYQSVR